MPFPTTSPNKDPKKVWTNADLKPYPNLQVVVERDAPPPMSPEEEAYLRGDDINGGASVEDVLAGAKAALARYGTLTDETNRVASAMGRDRQAGIRPESKYESLYWRANDAIDPQLRQMVTTMAPLAMGAGGPLGAGAGALVAANEGFAAGRPNMEAGERALHGLYGTLAVPGSARALAMMAGKPTAREAALAAERAATAESVAGARGLKGAGYSHSAAGKIAGVPSRGKSSATNINNTTDDVGRPPLNIRKPAGQTVPVPRDLRNIPESTYQRDLELLGGRQGATDMRGAQRRVPGGEVDETTYQFLLKMLGGRGDDVAGGSTSANAAARSEQVGRVPGGKAPHLLGEGRSPSKIQRRNDQGIRVEQAMPKKARGEKPAPKPKPAPSNIERSNTSMLSDEAGKRTVMFGGAGGSKLGSQVVDTTTSEGQDFISQLIAGLRRAVKGLE